MLSHKIHYKCFRCNGEWDAKDRGYRPVVCRYCKNPLWHTPKEILKEVLSSEDQSKYISKNTTILKYFLNLSSYHSLASLGLTQSELAEQVGVSQERVSVVLAKLSRYINSKREKGRNYYSINFQSLLKTFMEQIISSVLEKLQNEKGYFIEKMKDANKKYRNGMEAKKLEISKKIELVKNLMPIEVFLKNNSSLSDLLVEELQVAFSNVLYEYERGKTRITLSKIRDIFSINLVKYLVVFESNDLSRKSLQILFEEYTKIVVLQYY